MKSSEFMSRVAVNDPEALIVKSFHVVGLYCLPVHVYHDNALGDCTNNGVSNRFDTLYLPNSNGPVEVLLDENGELPDNVCGVHLKELYNGEDYLYLEPYKAPEGVGWMMGGNFAFSSDSRFKEDYSSQPIAIHDHQEFWK